jgi:hypothetical protein
MQTPKARNQRMASPTGVARIFAAKHGVSSGGAKKKPEPSTPTGLGELMATPARAVVPRGRSITPQQSNPALSPAALHTSLNSSKKRLLSAASRVEDLTPRAKNSKTAKRLKGDLNSRKQAAAEQRRLARAATKSAPFSPDATVAQLYRLPKTPTETMAPASPTGLAAMMKTPGAYKATLGKQQAAATGSKRKRPTQEREPSPGVMKRTFASPKPKKTKMSAILSPGGMHRTFASPMVSAQAARSPTRSIGSPAPVVLPAAEEKKPSRRKGRATKVEKETKEDKTVSPSPKKPRGRATRNKAAAIVTPVSASPKVRATRGRRAAQSQAEAAPEPTKVEAVATSPAPKRGRGKKAATATATASASAESVESPAATSKSGKVNTTSARSSRANKGKKDKETVVASPVASPLRTRRSARLR